MPCPMPLAGVSLSGSRERELLEITAPGGRATLLADRDWHIFWEDARMAILKRLDAGRVIAQCNLMKGPGAGRGRHQDPGQFRDDIRRGLKDRFVQFSAPARSTAPRTAASATRSASRAAKGGSASSGSITCSRAPMATSFSPRSLSSKIT